MSQTHVLVLKSNGSIVLEGLYLVETEAVEGSAALSLIQKCTVDV